MPCCGLCQSSDMHNPACKPGWLPRLLRGRKLGCSPQGIYTVCADAGVKQDRTSGTFSFDSRAEGSCSLQCLEAVCKVQQANIGNTCKDGLDAKMLGGAILRHLDDSCLAMDHTSMMPAKFKCPLVSFGPSSHNLKAPA